MVVSFSCSINVKFAYLLKLSAGSQKFCSVWSEFCLLTSFRWLFRLKLKVVSVFSNLMVVFFKSLLLYCLDCCASFLYNLFSSISDSPLKPSCMIHIRFNDSAWKNGMLRLRLLDYSDIRWIQNKPF